MEIGNNTKRDQRDHPPANAGAEELDWAVAQRKPSGEIVERNTYQSSDRHQRRGRHDSYSKALQHQHWIERREGRDPNGKEKPTPKEDAESGVEDGS